MNRELLEIRLKKVFGGTADRRRVVVRQAGDLHDSGKYETDHDVPLDVDTVIGNLADAPDEYDLTERWNWWIGSMDIAHGGYERFHIRTVGGSDDSLPANR